MLYSVNAVTKYQAQAKDLLVLYCQKYDFKRHPENRKEFKNP